MLDKIECYHRRVNYTNTDFLLSLTMYNVNDLTLVTPLSVMFLV